METKEERIQRQRQQDSYYHTHTYKQRWDDSSITAHLRTLKDTLAYIEACEPSYVAAANVDIELQCFIVGSPILFTARLDMPPRHLNNYITTVWLLENCFSYLEEDIAYQAALAQAAINKEVEATDSDLKIQDVHLLPAYLKIMNTTLGNVKRYRAFLYAQFKTFPNVQDVEQMGSILRITYPTQPELFAKSSTR